MTPAGCHNDANDGMSKEKQQNTDGKNINQSTEYKPDKEFMQDVLHDRLGYFIFSLYMSFTLICQLL